MQRVVAAFILCATVGVVRADERAPYHHYVDHSNGGKVSCAPPKGWQAPGADERSFVPRLLGAPDGGAPTTTVPDGGLAPGCAPGVGALYVRWQFDVGPEAAKLVSLTMRLRYQHGFAAYLNGTEIARRRLDPNADPTTMSTEVHGPEPESFVVPLKDGVLRGRGNVLAIEAHPRTPGRVAMLDAELFGSDAPRAIRGPYFLRIGERDAVLVVDTDLPTRASVTWGKDCDECRRSDEPSTHHVFTLDRLQPNSSVPYEVRLGERSLGESGFHTQATVGHAVRFVAYGDVRSGHDIHAQLNERLLIEDPDFALITGDLVDRGSDEGDWERFFEVARKLLVRMVMYPAPGNHEYARLGQGAARFMQLFRPFAGKVTDDGAYYSFDVAGLHFVALDSNQYRSPRQAAWLDHDLGDARKRGMRGLFVYAHAPPYTSGLHGDNAIAIQDYVPIMVRHKVTLFFGGHDHDYERGRVGEFDYIVTGGGGAELRAQRCGVAGKKACPPRVLTFVNDFNYVLVEVIGKLVRVCPRRPDGSPIEACVQLKLR